MACLTQHPLAFMTFTVLPPSISLLTRYSHAFNTVTEFIHSSLPIPAFYASRFTISSFSPSSKSCFFCIFLFLVQLYIFAYFYYQVCVSLYFFFFQNFVVSLCFLFHLQYFMSLKFELRILSFSIFRFSLSFIYFNVNLLIFLITLPWEWKQNSYGIACSRREKKSS